MILIVNVQLVYSSVRKSEYNRNRIDFLELLIKSEMK